MGTRIISPDQALVLPPGGGDRMSEQGGFLVPPSELVGLCAEDTGFYNRTFFPRAFRQKSPPFHYEIFDALENPLKRLVAIKVFRGGAKTTILRAFVSKRIAYGVSHTVLFVSKSQGHSEKSLAWLKRQIEYNQNWTSIFGLRKGSKWTDEEIEIYHKAFDEPITIKALGITGQVRGININDYRPDLIVIDDPCDEENTATEEQRKKTEDLIFGALMESLAPKSECPDAKLGLLQTPLHPLDVISKAAQDPSFFNLEFGQLDSEGQSIWPSRFPTEVVLEEKAQAIARNQLPLWTREKMCRIISAETAEFCADWLQYWDILPTPMVTALGIDPVPPPSEREISLGLRGKDYEVIAAVGYGAGNFYLCAYEMNHGHQPDWTIAKFFEMATRFRPLRSRAEGVNYQRTLKWILEKEMQTRRQFFQINSVTDKRSKRHRISQAFVGICSQRRFFVHSSMHEFISQFMSYPSVDHDDLLDAVAMAVDELMGQAVDLEGELPEQQEVEKLGNWRAAP